MTCPRNRRVRILIARVGRWSQSELRVWRRAGWGTGSRGSDSRGSQPV